MPGGSENTERAAGKAHKRSDKSLALRIWGSYVFGWVTRWDEIHGNWYYTMYSGNYNYRMFTTHFISHSNANAWMVGGWYDESEQWDTLIFKFSDTTDMVYSIEDHSQYIRNSYDYWSYDEMNGQQLEFVEANADSEANTKRILITESYLATRNLPNHALVDRFKGKVFSNGSWHTFNKLEFFSNNAVHMYWYHSDEYVAEKIGKEFLLEGRFEIDQGNG